MHRAGNACIFLAHARVKGVRAQFAITTARAAPRFAACVKWEQWFNVDSSPQPLDGVVQYRHKAEAPPLAAYAISRDVERRGMPHCLSKSLRELSEMLCALVPDLLQDSAVSADMTCHRLREVLGHGVVAHACDV